MKAVSKKHRKYTKRLPSGVCCICNGEASSWSKRTCHGCTAEAEAIGCGICSSGHHKGERMVPLDYMAVTEGSTTCLDCVRASKTCVAPEEIAAKDAKANDESFYQRRALTVALLTGRAIL